MVMIPELWLSILLSAVLVWIASAIVWMVLPHHKKDWEGLPDEEAVRNALKAQNAGPGQYWVPWAQGSQAMKDPEVVGKYQEGPVGFLTLVTPKPISMGKPMVLSFVYYVIVTIGVAYITGRTLGPGSDYWAVFRVAGSVGWMACAAAIVPDAIWFGRPWSNTWMSVLDGLLYGLLMAGAFGGFWPEA